MSPAVSFIAGFLAALMLAAAVLYGLYVQSRRNRASGLRITGYLDLIPDLTNEQRERVQEIRRVFLPRVETIRGDMRANRAELAELLFDEPSDRARIGEVAAQIMGHQRELEREVIEHILEEKELLSPAQRRRFHDIIVEQFSAGGLGVHDVGPKR
ncbi:MAG: Spy/CpxP family protein refolding chaperone [Desulfobacteraceae bacterium]|nr:Spy/CpxP family protein refolding chaperone [Desulfobacteraceae bacterium]